MAKAQSGKSTTAKYLKQYYGAQRLSIADPIKKIVQKMFDFTDEQVWGDLKEVVDPRWGFAPRKPMQDLGYWGREFMGKNVWLDLVLKQMEELDSQLFILDDVRYETTVDYLNLMDMFSETARGVPIKLVFQGRETTDDGTHESEAGIDRVPEEKFVAVINHERTPNASDLKSQIDRLALKLGIEKRTE